MADATSKNLEVEETSANHTAHLKAENEELRRQMGELTARLDAFIALNTGATNTGAAITGATTIDDLPPPLVYSLETEFAARYLLQRNYIVGKGLGIDLQGETHPRQIPSQIGTFGLGYEPIDEYHERITKRRRTIGKCINTQPLKPSPPGSFQNARSPIRNTRNPPKPRKYTPLAASMADVLDILLGTGQLSIIPATTSSQDLAPARAKLNCAYHSGQIGHDTEECRTLRNAIQRIIDAGAVMVADESPQPTPNVTSNPLPNHQGDVMVSAEEDFSPQNLIGPEGSMVVYQTPVKPDQGANVMESKKMKGTMPARQQEEGTSKLPSKEFMALLARTRVLRGQVSAIEAWLENMSLHCHFPSVHFGEGHQYVPPNHSLSARMRVPFSFDPSHLKPVGTCSPNPPKLRGGPSRITPFFPKTSINRLHAAPPKLPVIRLPARIPENPKKFTRGKGVYPPIAISQKEVFKILLASGHLTPVPAPPQPHFLSSFPWPNLKCAYHSNEVGHDVEYCQALRKKILKLIDTKAIILYDITPADEASCSRILGARKPQ